MNKANEISKVQTLLKIPVSDLLFTPEIVEVISGSVNIGSLPYYNVAGILTYDTSVNVVNWLKWIEIYNENKPEIYPKIVELLGTDKFIVHYGTFRNLYIKNQEEPLSATVTCSFADGWFVAKS